MKRVLICDLGNVLIAFDRTKTYRKIADYLQADPSVIERIIEDSGIRTAYERGDKRFGDSTEFLKAIRQLLQTEDGGWDVPLEVLRAAWNDIFRENVDVTAAVRYVRREKGIPVILLSDTNELHYQFFRSEFTHIHELFDAEILSFEVQLSKERNATELLNLALREAQTLAPEIPAKHVLYVDDRADFIAAAERLGIRGHVFTDANGFVHWLEEEGVVT